MELRMSLSSSDASRDASREFIGDIIIYNIVKFGKVGNFFTLQNIVFYAKLCYVYLNMPLYAMIKFNRAAFKHDVSEADILRAFETFVYEDPIDDADNKYLLVGFNLLGNLIEVMYNKIDDDAINVFHAMPCRKAFRELVEE